MTNWSISARIKMPTNHPSGIQRIFSHQAASGMGQYWGLAVRDHKITALSSLDSITYPTGIGSDLHDGNWHRLDVVRDTVNDKFYYYVDGVEITNVTITNNSAYNVTADPVIGGWKEANEEFSGQISDLAVWGRARTAAEIAAYNSNPYLPFEAPGAGNALRQLQLIVAG